MSTACWTCRELVTYRGDLMEHRLEYRRKGDEARYKVVLLGRLCRACAQATVDVHVSPGGDPTCTCGGPPTYERRQEFRRKSDDGRWRVLLDGWRCGDCTDLEVAALRPDPPAQGEQVDLFG